MSNPQAIQHPIKDTMTVSVVATSPTLPPSAADEDTTQICGISVLRTNSILRKPVLDWSETFGTSNFPTLFLYNELPPARLNIDEHIRACAVLAGGISPDYLPASGKENTFKWTNVPLTRIPVLTDLASVKKESLRGLRIAQPLKLAQSAPQVPSHSASG